MKLKISTITIAMLLTSTTFTAVAAADNEKMMKEFERLMNRTQMLEKQIIALQSKVKSLEKEKRQKGTQSSKKQNITSAQPSKQWCGCCR